jgi:hypothetical protein
MRRSDEGNTFTLKFSIVGLYLEQLYDLLNPQTRHSPCLSEDVVGIRVVGATEAYCFDETEVMSLVERGHACRDGLSSNMNLDLRFFHTFFIFTLEQYNSASGVHKSSRMWFANVVGSHTADGTYKKTEARIFERSSSILGSFVHSLKDGTAHNFNYQASKLTTLLKEAFLAGSFATSIVTASPSSLSISDTLKAIKFGQTIKKVNKPSTVTQIQQCIDNDMNTDDLKSKYMSAQSELLVWRQLADSLKCKTFQLEHALKEEKQLVEKLITEKSTFEQHAEELLNARENNSNYDFKDVGDALSFFDYGDISVDHAATDSTVDQVVETKSESVTSNRRPRKSSVESLHRNNSVLLASMTTSAGMSSLADLDDLETLAELDTEETRPADDIAFDMNEAPAAVDLSHVNAFSFMKEIERSYPKLNVIRGGEQPFKYNSTSQESLYHQSLLLQEKAGLKVNRPPSIDPANS